jgi:excisionase family DNA binding protein
VIRPVRRFEQLEHFEQLLARIAEMRAQDATAQCIADRLNAEGWRPPKKGSFDAAMICRLLQRRGLGSKRPIWSGHVPRTDETEVTLQELADRLGVSRQTVYGWLRRGQLKGRLARVGRQRIWLIKLTDTSTRTNNRESS